MQCVRSGSASQIRCLFYILFNPTDNILVSKKIFFRLNAMGGSASQKNASYALLISFWILLIISFICKFFSSSFLSLKSILEKSASPNNLQIKSFETKNVSQPKMHISLIFFIPSLILQKCCLFCKFYYVKLHLTKLYVM